MLLTIYYVHLGQHLFHGTSKSTIKPKLMPTSIAPIPPPIVLADGFLFSADDSLRIALFVDLVLTVSSLIRCTNAGC